MVENVSFKAVLLLIQVFLVVIVSQHWKDHRTLSVGLILVCLGAVSDLVDEFYQMPRWVTVYAEGALISLGALLIAVGIWYWLGREESLKSNQETRNELRVGHERLSALYAVTASASGSLDLDTILKEVVQRITETFHFDVTRIYLLDPQRDELLLRAFFETKAGLFPQPSSYRLGQGTVGRVVEAGEPMIIENVQVDLRYQEFGSNEVQGSGFCFLGVFPITCKVRTMGAIVCVGKDPRRLIRDEIQLIMSMGHQIGIAVVNANLFAETKKALMEREALLKEVHHRVKNNLQVISSLLSLQAAHLRDNQSLEMFKESQNRVGTIALVHEKLYASARDFTKINFVDYIQSLTTQIFQTYGVNTDNVRLNVNAEEELLVEIDTAIPCGLIINELVTNSLRHAFPAGRTGEITIDLGLDNEDQFTLVVSDNGVGLPHGLDFRNAESLGLQLVNTLTGQLDGTIELGTTRGTEFRITFLQRKRR